MKKIPSETGATIKSRSRFQRDFFAFKAQPIASGQWTGLGKQTSTSSKKLLAHVRQLSYQFNRLVQFAGLNSGDSSFSVALPK